MLDHPKYYNFLLKNYPKDIELPSEKQIDLDINRTFPEDPMFHLSEVKQKLRNILLCYSKRNLTIGYVQGFNFIVGRILKYISDEEKAFWVFCQIIEIILPLNFYSGMSGLIADIDILLGLFKEMYMPEFNDLMKEAHFIYLKNVLLQWFLSIFVINFPIKPSIAIWDILFIDKNIVLFKIAIYLIKLIKGNLLAIKDMEQFKNYIRDYFDNFNNIEYIKYVLLLRKFEFDDKFIEYNRTVFLKPIIDNINRNCEDKIKKLKENNKDRKDYCDSSWPFCIYDCESYYRISDFLVFRQAQVSIIDDYCDCYNNNNNNAHSSIRSIKRRMKDINYQTAVIERKHHICNSKQRKKIKISLECQMTSDSDLSVYSSETDKSNEEEDEYNLRKIQYKKSRANMKCISSINFMKNKKRTESCIVNKNNNDNNNENDNNRDDFNLFISKLGYHYQKCSVAKEVTLTRKETNIETESYPLSLKI